MIWFEAFSRLTCTAMHLHPMAVVTQYVLLILEWGFIKVGQDQMPIFSW